MTIFNCQNKTLSLNELISYQKTSYSQVNFGTKKIIFVYSYEIHLCTNFEIEIQIPGQFELFGRYVAFVQQIRKR